MSGLNAFVSDINSAIISQNSQLLCSIFSFDFDGTITLIVQEWTALSDHQRNSKYLPELDELWYDFISNYLNSIQSLSVNGASEFAFGTLTITLQSLHRIFQNSNRWLLPLVFTSHSFLWSVSKKLNAPQQEEAARIINKCLVICLTDRNVLSISRKWGVYRLFALLMKIYFYLGQLNLGRNIVRAVEVAELPPVDRATPHLVEFCFWRGRYHFVNEEWPQAEQDLSEAFIHCPSNYYRHKRIILHYLIPLKIQLNCSRPSISLLRRYNMNKSFYADALNALYIGDLDTYRTVVARYDKPLLKLGTFLLWERLEFLALRNLFRKFFLIIGNSSRIPLHAFILAFSKMRTAMDIDDIECFVANLISKGYIKGYLSHEKSTLVLSQKDPFPSN